MLPLFCLWAFFGDIKSNNLSISQTKAVKSKILDTAFSFFDSFNNKKIENNFSKDELKVSRNLRKQKYLVIKKADKGSTVALTE